ncbi:MAG: glycosyltransferase, partial [Clostridia bacterium]|nr:glycosyltransferase [Clostridia bacterium]
FIDDCSTDNSQKIIKKHQEKNSKIKLIISEKNVGVSKARNKGIEVANGRFLTYIDADDLWLKEKLEKQVKFITDNNYEFITCNFKYMSDNGIWLGKTIKPIKETDYKKSLINTRMIPATVMIDLNKISKEICYMPDVIMEDTASWWNILRHGHKLYGQDEVLAYYRKSATARSGKKLKTATYRWSLYRDYEKLGLVKSIYCFIPYAINAIYKRMGQKKEKRFKKIEKFQIALSTQNLKNDDEANKLIEKMRIKSDYLIVNQTYEKEIDIKNDRIITRAETGLSRSRNVVIENSKSDIVLLSDNDVIYNDKYEKIILDAYKKYKKADIICFYVESLNHKRKIKRMHTGKIGYIRAMRVISTEVSFKREAILNSKVRFNTILGPGTDLKIADELSFICSALRNGLNVVFVNKKIADVEQKESTYFEGYTKEYLKTQCTAFKVVYPKFYKIINLQYVIRKYYLYKKNIKFIEALKLISKI